MAGDPPEKDNVVTTPHDKADKKAYKDLDDSQIFLAYILMNAAHNYADNNGVLKLIEEATGFDNLAEFVKEQKKLNNNTENSVFVYSDYTDQGLRNVNNLPAKFLSSSTYGQSLLNPEISIAVRKDPQKLQYLDWIYDAAKQNNLDPNLFANQIWAESNFRPSVKSGVGAIGIAQFMPSTGKLYGLSEADLLDPEKSIYASARHMKDLTDKFGGNQVLALAGYNGGSRSVTHLHEKYGKDITIDEWMSHMEEQRRIYGTTDPSKWRVQTYDYIKKISSDYWPPQKQQYALSLSGKPFGDTSKAFAEAKKRTKPYLTEQEEIKPKTNKDQFLLASHGYDTNSMQNLAYGFMTIFNILFRYNARNNATGVAWDISQAVYNVMSREQGEPTQLAEIDQTQTPIQHQNPTA